MKPTIVFLVLVLFLASCSKTETGNVKVKFTNTTGHQLKRLKIGDQRIGPLGNNEQTKYIPFYEFHFDSGLPDEPAEAMINGKKAHDITEFYWCGTQKYSVDEGTFEMDITLIEYDNKNYLRLDRK